MINPDYTAFYKDVSRPPQDGEEFIELVWGNGPSGFEVCVIRGKHGEKDSHRPKSYTFATRDEALKAVEKHSNDARRAGFAEYKLPFVLEGKPL